MEEKEKEELPVLTGPLPPEEQALLPVPRKTRAATASSALTSTVATVGGGKDTASGAVGMSWLSSFFGATSPPNTSSPPFTSAKASALAAATSSSSPGDVEEAATTMGSIAIHTAALDLSECVKKGVLLCSQKDKRQTEKTRFALTKTHLWVYRRDHFTPFIDLRTLTDVFAAQSGNSGGPSPNKQQPDNKQASPISSTNEEAPEEMSITPMETAECNCGGTEGCQVCDALLSDKKAKEKDNDDEAPQVRRTNSNSAVPMAYVAQHHHHHIRMSKLLPTKSGTPSKDQESVLTKVTKYVLDRKPSPSSPLSALVEGTTSLQVLDTSASSTSSSSSASPSSLVVSSSTSSLVVPSSSTITPKNGQASGSLPSSSANSWTGWLFPDSAADSKRQDKRSKAKPWWSVSSDNHSTLSSGKTVAGQQPLGQLFHFVVITTRRDFTAGNLYIRFSTPDVRNRDEWIRAIKACTISLPDSLMGIQQQFETEILELAQQDAADTSAAPLVESGGGTNEIKHAATFLKTRKLEEQNELKRRKQLGLAEAKLTLLELITSKGYSAEEHKVITQDGYILTLHRIPRNKEETQRWGKVNNKPVVFLMHGLLDCSVTWILGREAESLAFILSTHGYDVWMGNSRGNRYSREHISLSVDQDAFWQFNRDHLVEDAAASIDYILETTKQKHLTYIGHSQGTNIAFALLTSRPSFRSKLNLFVALAPAVYVQNHKSKMLSYLSGIKTDRLFQLMGIQQFMGTGMGFANARAPMLVLNSPRLSKWVAQTVFKALCGWNPDDNFGMDRFPILAAHQPGGTSVLVMAHWAQAVRTGRFCRYDHGPKKNMEIYNSTEPPSYQISQLANVPLAIFYGGQDKLTTPEDVERLLRELPHPPAYVQFEQEYAHLDFVWGVDACVKIYPKICELASHFTQLQEDALQRLQSQQQDAAVDDGRDGGNGSYGVEMEEMEKQKEKVTEEEKKLNEEMGGRDTNAAKGEHKVVMMDMSSS
ncbi:Hydrolase, alpha/beta fold domain containing protein [Balamuthia mandrillaris]